jgi:hypothetical protein
VCDKVTPLSDSLRTGKQRIRDEKAQQGANKIVCGGPNSDVSASILEPHRRLLVCSSVPPSSAIIHESYISVASRCDAKLKSESEGAQFKASSAKLLR